MGRPGGVSGKNDSLPKKYALCCLSATAAETGMYMDKKKRKGSDKGVKKEIYGFFTFRATFLIYISLFFYNQSLAFILVLSLC